jgi:hypothetical protein
MKKTTPKLATPKPIFLELATSATDGDLKRACHACGRVLEITPELRHKIHLGGRRPRYICFGCSVSKIGSKSS